MKGSWAHADRTIDENHAPVAEPPPCPTSHVHPQYQEAIDCVRGRVADRSICGVCGQKVVET